jgi:hypothetical protein
MAAALASDIGVGLAGLSIEAFSLSVGPAARVDADGSGQKPADCPGRRVYTDSLHN